MIRRALIGGGTLGVAVLETLSCARLNYEPPPDGSFTPPPNETNVTRGGGFEGDARANDAGTASGGGAASGSGGTGSSPDAGGTGEGGGVGTSGGGTSGVTLAGCEPAEPTATWSFAGDAEGWQLEADPGASGNLSWTGAIGNPAPGALAIDATVADTVNNVRIYLDQSPSDLTRKVLYARVFLESGSGASAKAFVQSDGGAWGDGHEVYLDAQQWYCVSYDPQAPAVSISGLDNTAVRRIGVFFFGEASAHLYVDQISY